RVREEVGLPLTVGVAGNKFLAKLASTRGKADGRVGVARGRAVGVVQRRVGEAGARPIAVVPRFASRTVGDVAATPRPTLERALGPAAGAQLHDLAWAHDEREVVPCDAAKSGASGETLARDS